MTNEAQAAGAAIVAVVAVVAGVALCLLIRARYYNLRRLPQIPEEVLQLLQFSFSASPASHSMLRAGGERSR